MKLSEEKPSRPKRAWSGVKPVLISVVVGVVVAVLSTVIIVRLPPPEPRQQRETALLLGHDAAFALARAIEGQSIEQATGQIEGYLRKLSLDDVEYPSDPLGTGRDAQPAAEFAQRITGRLSVHGEAIEAAFILGWYGVITTNTPDLIESFDLCEFAEKAEFESEQNDLECASNEEGYFQSLIDNIRILIE